MPKGKKVLKESEFKESTKTLAALRANQEVTKFKKYNPKVKGAVASITINKANGLQLTTWNLTL